MRAGKDRSSATGAAPAKHPLLAELAVLAELGDEGGCLDYLRDLVFPPGTACPGCGRPSRFHRVRGRSAYACQYCGCHVYPTAGTIFRRSTTDLRTWFQAIRFVGSRLGGITARELADELGVARPTASRMLALIVPVVEVGPELLFVPPPSERAPASGTATPPRDKGARAPEAGLLSPDLVRDELLATLEGLRQDIRSAELRALDAQAEVAELRLTVAAIEQVSAGDAGSTDRRRRPGAALNSPLKHGGSESDDPSVDPESRQSRPT